MVSSKQFFQTNIVHDSLPICTISPILGEFSVSSLHLVSAVQDVINFMFLAGKHKGPHHDVSINHVLATPEGSVTGHV